MRTSRSSIRSRATANPPRRTFSGGLGPTVGPDRNLRARVADVPDSLGGSASSSQGRRGVGRPAPHGTPRRAWGGGNRAGPPRGEWPRNAGACATRVARVGRGSGSALPSVRRSGRVRCPSTPEVGPSIGGRAPRPAPPLRRPSRRRPGLGGREIASRSEKTRGGAGPTPSSGRRDPCRGRAVSLRRDRRRRPGDASTRPVGVLAPVRGPRSVRGRDRRASASRVRASWHDRPSGLGRSRSGGSAGRCRPRAGSPRTARSRSGYRTPIATVRPHAAGGRSPPRSSERDRAVGPGVADRVRPVPRSPDIARASPTRIGGSP